MKQLSIPIIHLLQKNINPCQLVVCATFQITKGAILRAKVFVIVAIVMGLLNMSDGYRLGYDAIWCRQGTLGGIKVLIKMHG